MMLIPKQEYIVEESKVNSLSSSRLDNIDSAFKEQESHARRDLVLLWQKAESEKFAKKEFLDFSPDVVVRTIRSSMDLIHPERRLDRNLRVLRKRAKLRSILKSKHVETSRLDMFRSLVFPLRIYGKSKTGETPILKISASEPDWQKAAKIFVDPTEVKQLSFLLLEQLMEKMKALGCLGESANPDVYVASKFVLVIDATEYSWTHLHMAMRMNFANLGRALGKLFPEVLCKVYVLTGDFRSRMLVKHTLRGLKVSSYFTGMFKSLVSKVSYIASETELLDELVSTDNFSLSQLPNEIGGQFEGRYVLD